MGVKRKDQRINGVGKVRLDTCGSCGAKRPYLKMKDRMAHKICEKCKKPFWTIVEAMPNERDGYGNKINTLLNGKAREPLTKSDLEKVVGIHDAKRKVRVDYDEEEDSEEEIAATNRDYEVQNMVRERFDSMTIMEGMEYMQSLMDELHASWMNRKDPPR